MSSGNILIVDDELEVRTLISDVLSDEGYKTNLAADEQSALTIIKKITPDLVFLDLWIGDDESAGLKILEKIKKICPEIPIVIISGHGTIDIAVQSIQRGAFDFIEKPFVIDRLLLTSRRAIELYKLKKENYALKNNKLNVEVFSVGKSQFALSIKPTIEKISCTNSRIFIKSQIGMGVDAIAFDIHKKSARKEHPFIYINCISDDKEKLESELFGTEKLYGFFEKANMGTIFLEDITKLSKSCQRKLLQSLQEDKYSVGNRNIYSDVRIICSSSDILENQFNSDKFSRELFYRLNIVSIDIPSIKNRRCDILPLINYYLLNSEHFFGLKSKNFTESALAILQSYDWPGNIHQIKNIVESALISSLDKYEIDDRSLPPELTSNTKDKFDSLNIAKFISLPIKEAKDCFESDYLRAQVNRFSGNISQTALFIGMERSALHRKLKNLGVYSDKKTKNSQES